MNRMFNRAAATNRGFSLAHVVFFASFALLLFGCMALRLAWGITSISDELTKVLLALVCAAAVFSLGYYFRVLDRFPRKYPALGALLAIAVMIVVVFHDNLQSGVVHHRELLVFFALVSLSLVIYASKGTGIFGVARCLAATLSYVFVTCGANDANSGMMIIVVSLVLTTFGVATKWFSSRKIWIQIILLLVSVFFSYIVLLVLYPKTNYSIWEDLFGKQIIPVPDLDWMGENNPILSFNIMKSARFVGATDPVFPLQEAADWHLFTYIAHQGGWVALIAAIAVFAAMIISGFILASRHRGLRRFLSIGAMTWTLLTLSGYILFSFGINYWQVKTVPVFTANFLGNVIMFVGFGVVTSTKRGQCYVAKPSRLNTERELFWNEFPEWIENWPCSESACYPSVNVWIEDVAAIAKDIKEFFSPTVSTVHPVDSEKLSSALDPDKNCALFRYSGLLKDAGMAMVSFALTRDHVFIKFIAPPNAPMKKVLDIMEIYNSGNEKGADFCIEIDDAIDIETLEIVGIGI